MTESQTSSSSSPAGSSSPKVTVFLPTKNAGPNFDAVLRAVRNQRTDFAFDIRAIDSGSTDDTVACLRDHDVDVTAIDPDDFGHGKTRTRGVLATSAEFVAILSQDAEPADEHWLTRLAAPFDDPTVAGTWARQIPRADCHPFLRPNLDAHMAQCDASEADATNIQEPLDLVTWSRLEPASRVARIAFDDVSSMVRRAVVERHPFPDVDFGEDIAWARSVLFAGHRIAFVGGAEVVHSHEFHRTELTSRVEATHRALRRETNFVPIPNLGWRFRRAAGQTLRFWRAVARADDIEGRRRRMVSWLTAPIWAWRQMAAMQRGGRHGRYIAPVSQKDPA